jgi:TRAP-type uncharacterized transport system substrate-binding protein
MILKTIRIRYRTALTLLALLLLPLLVYLSKPYPMEPLRLAIGQKGSSYEALGQSIATYFAKHGLKVELIETGGMDESVNKLDDDHSVINAAFMTAGKPPPIEWSGLSSLGSVQYSPLWLIYRGETPQSELALFNKRIAIGNDGTNTQNLFYSLAHARGYPTENQPNFVKVAHAEAVTLLNSGAIDAVFIADGLDSENVRNLLSNPDNRIYSFELADAYTHQIPYLHKLSIPQGALDLKTMRPEQPKTILATSTTLLVENELHPLTQWMLIRAVRQINNGGTRFFAPPNFFPAQLDGITDLSPIAERYYEHGFPGLTEYMPWWLAIYLDRIWVLMLTLLAVIVPLRELKSAIQDLQARS